MGWGFAIIVEKTDKKEAISTLEKAGVQPEQIGKVTDKEEIVIHYKNKKIILT
jgi:phosphoribosylaminoimidazole (AIR) synthetase